MINGGIIMGALIAALLSGEFKIRLVRQKRRYFQILLGGVLMGYGAGLAGGCTIGGFFSAVPSLGLNGFVFGGAIALGAFLGLQAIKRIG
ncbi:MAG: YeeE/YedE family protein [Dehalococcoidales bacterium]|nr:YeeE/YedE family protein [Dehalococcoidales bacterium]